MRKERMTLRKWYGGSMRLPYLGTFAASNFLVSTVGLVRSICLNRLDIMPRIKFQRGGTAAADQVNNVIYINEDYLNGEFSPEIHLTDTDDVFTIILGLIVHEVAHFAYSPADLKPFAEYVKEHSPFPYHEKMAMTLGNVVEDIFIEAQVDRDVPSLTWMVDKMNDLLFTDEIEERVLSRVVELTEAPENLESAVLILSTLILAKVRYHIETNLFVYSLFQIAMTATEAATLEQRKEITLDLYNRLMEKVVLSEEECKKGEQPLENAGKTIRGITSDQSGETKSYFQTHEEEAIAIEDDLEKYEDISVTLMREGESEALLVTEEGVRGGESGAMEIDKRYEVLAQLARQNAVVNRPYGMDRSRGTHIRKLHRIATDSKIFADPLPMNLHKPMEVVLLVDCSGSMKRGDHKGTLLEKAWSAACGAGVALSEGHCAVSVYGHTADLSDKVALNIYCAKGFNDPIDNLPFSAAVIAREKEAYENRDGSAIRYMLGKFTTGRKHRRMLIVFSDGAPAANDYGGAAAVNHSQRQVELLRSQGIEVLSISLTAWSVSTNNQIYGEKNNIFNEDPNIIEKIVESIVL